MIINYASTLKDIEQCQGFKAHIRSYTKAFNDNFFTAKVARYLISRNYKVILEPKMNSRNGGHPDLFVQKEGISFYGECKTSDITNYYDYKNKKEIADLVYERVLTCDQIIITLSKPIKPYEFKKFLTDELLQKIYMSFKIGKDGNESNIKVSQEIDLLITQKPVIIGKESDYPTAQLWMILENNHNNARSIGITFLKGGRSIGVFEIVDYEKKLKNKKEQSQNQIIEGHPNIIFLRDSDIVGDPAIHETYIKTEWLTESLKFCSGVVMFDTYREGLDPKEIENLKFYKNNHAAFPIDF